jgi:Peptidase_C39 like family
MTPRRRLLAAGGAALALPGCAVFSTPPQTRALSAAGPAAWPASVPPRVELRDVPFVPQTPLHCGPATLAMALQHVGIAADADQLGRQVFLPARGGTLQLELLAGARRQGALATRVPGQLAALVQELAAGHAVVVFLNLGLAMSPVWHYAVLVGHDRDEQVFVLRSGPVARDVFSWRTFELTWARGGHWAVVVLPPGRLPATAEEAEAEAAAVGFERVAAPALAERAYAALLARWPASLPAAMGLGNTRHAGANLPGAAEAFEQAAQRHDSAATWNNLARVRAALGQPEAAREAARRAVRRAETAEPQWQAPARATLAAVGG